LLHYHLKLNPVITVYYSYNISFCAKFLTNFRQIFLSYSSRWEILGINLGKI